MKYLSNKGSLGFFFQHSSSLDKETKAAYDNYKSSDWKSSMLWFPEMTTTNRKKGDLLEKTTQTFSLIERVLLNVKNCEHSLEHYKKNAIRGWGSINKKLWWWFWSLKGRVSLMSESVKKSKFATEIFFSDNIEWSSKNLWKIISADVKANKNKRKWIICSGGCRYLTNFCKKYISSKLVIQCTKGMYFSFDFGWYSIHLDVYWGKLCEHTFFSLYLFQNVVSTKR